MKANGTSYANIQMNNSSWLFHPHMTRTVGFAVSKTATYLRTDLTRNNVNKN